MEQETKPKKGFKLEISGTDKVILVVAVVAFTFGIDIKYIFTMLLGYAGWYFWDIKKQKEKKEEEKKEEEKKESLAICSP